MSILRTAIWNLFTTDVNHAFYVDIGGRMYYEEALQDPTWPYCVFRFYDQVYDFEFVEQFENTSIQFDIFSLTRSADEVDDAITDLKTLFDYCSLTISGYTHLKMERQYSFVTKMQPDNAWMGVVRYEHLMQKN